MNLLIISHTPHYHKESQIVGWGPTVKEIDQLARLFDEIRHLAVLYKDEAPLSSMPYAANNVVFVPARPSGGETFKDKLGVLRAFLSYWKIIRQEINMLSDEDILHVRCPANISLLAIMILTFTRKPSFRWIKYAGNWQPEGKDPFTYALQRWMLKLNFPRSLVTINGKWAGQPEHVLSFHNPSLSENYARRISERKLSKPFRLMFAGNITEGKGAGRAIEVALQLLEFGLPIEMDVFGDGELRTQLEKRVEQSKQNDHFHFHGWRSHEELLPFYAEMHFILLPSRTEGWPKVLSEAMAYGVVPLAGAVSAIPQILEECKTGMALDPLDLQGFVNAICTYIDSPHRWAVESHAAQEAVKKFTYEAYLEHLTAMFVDKWQIEL
jgi:glycosyltransferase involved in cell wall biosynthesis